MKINHNGIVRYMTPVEEAEHRQYQQEQEREYWSVPYNTAVSREIRKRYSADAEFAILRQKDEKPEEYKRYFDYCESCKAMVKAKQAEYAVKSD